MTLYVWRYRDSEDSEWRYSEVPVNPEKWDFVDVFQIKDMWRDGERQ